MKDHLRAALSGGARSSIGNADNVIRDSLKDPLLLKEVYGLFLDDDPVVAMRASYVAMRVAESSPDSVKPYGDELMKSLELYVEKEVRWHVPQLLTRLDLTPQQRARAYEIVMNWAETDPSKIVGYYGFQAAAELASSDTALMKDFIPRLQRASTSEAKSIRNSCKKIAERFNIDITHAKKAQ